MLSTRWAARLPWPAILVATGAFLLIVAALGLGLRAVQHETQAREGLADSVEVGRQILELRYLAADLNGAHLAHSLDIWRSTAGALRDDHPARAQFLAAVSAFRAKLIAIDATRLTTDEHRQYLATQRAFDQFVRMQERIIGAYRRATSPGGGTSGTAGAPTPGPEVAHFEQTVELVGDLVSRVLARSDRNAVAAARAADRAAMWRAGFAALTVALGVLFVFLNFKAIMQRARMLAGLDALGRTDMVTGVATQGRFNEEMPLALERARRTERSVSVVMLDMDSLRAFNDTNGHQAGSRLLAATAKAFGDRLREGDLIARCGPEQFALILHGCTADAAREIVDRVHEVAPSSLSFSAGITDSDGHEEVNMMVPRAESALAAARHAGKNRTVIIRRDATVELQREPQLTYDAMTTH